LFQDQKPVFIPEIAAGIIRKPFLGDRKRSKEEFGIRS